MVHHFTFFYHSALPCKEHSFTKKPVRMSNEEQREQQYDTSLPWWHDSKNSKQIYLTLKASRVYLNDARIIPSSVDATNSIWFDKWFVNSEAAEKLEAGRWLKGLSPWWKDIVVFINSDGQKSWRCHGFLFVPQRRTIYTKTFGAVLLIVYFWTNVWG